MKIIQRKRIKGATLFEVVVGSGLSTIVLFSLTVTLLGGTTSWTKGQTKIQADVSSQQTLRGITSQLREAMSVTVTGDGTIVDYRLPMKDEEGSYIVPAAWDGVARRIYYNSANKKIIQTINGKSTVLCEDISTVDPATNNGYKFFIPGSGAIIRQLTVMLVIKPSTSSDTAMTSRIRETIYLRNVPIVTQ